MKSDTPKLTVAIPTYNRAGKLKEQIERLLPQLTPDVSACIYDNASTDTTRELADEYRSKGISYFRAKTNCGGERNFFRCFEECQTEWLWILSDDDAIVPNAIQQILDILPKQNGDYIQASCHLCQFRSDTLVCDIQSLFDHVNFSSLLWLSTGIYKVASFRPFFWLYNHAMSTGAPQAIIVLRMLEEKRGTVFLSSNQLTGTPTDNHVTWSTLYFITHVSLLPDYLSSPLHQKILAERIWKEHVDWALLVGLREITDIVTARKWKRVLNLVHYTLKSFGAKSPIGGFLKNWYKKGQRKETLKALRYKFSVSILGYCPARLVIPALKVFPLPDWVRMELLRGK